MIDIEAEQLAERIGRSWRGGIGTDMWFEVLQPLHHGPAEAAFRKLRDTLDHQPSIAQYRQAYNAELGTAPEPRVDCPTCGGDGWEPAVEHHHEHRYETVRPCRCRAGVGVRDVHRRIVNGNDGEFARLGITSQHQGVGPPVDILRRKDLE